ncbi:alanine racemase [Nitrosospira multiformis ATCC 25196]|uniref:Alanine racemase n=2 Tax=Nitrosospira multiformis (strain ATCC 25196 / NCIMB 11849 / C 71) TaxID=323848 RepID=ALR_NITMU|nr:alanine racemase [Nitrosospira multiformis]Q2Y763.1 RecName: Full=Alanine racemase [Nitrosospira multiformis ATCC 25196]ABB75408.1 alanine racemase [Nitrosospira multiformis ATCC 25196]SEF87049.1 alanine racemase [Nitrosospira multiformis ATCC 25196]
MSRPIQALIDPAALERNLAIVRRHAPRSRVMAVIKADAYGHGLLCAAEALAEAEGFALLELDAAVRLREAGYRQTILLLEGFFDIDELSWIEQYRLSTVVHHPEQLAMLEAVRRRATLDVFLKLNSGMNRLGFTPTEFPAALEHLKANPAVRQITLMTHFACADEPDRNDSIAAQLQCFNLAAGGRYMPRSLANSAAILRFPEAHADWVRPGIMLYGSSPLAHTTAEQLGLQPAMTVSSRIISVQTLRPNDGVGYGHAFRAGSSMRVGIVAGGYADGYPRHAPTGTPVLVKGRRTRIVGRISMDMLHVDLSEIEDAGVGSPVTLWGRGMPVDEVARAAGTLGYELLCAIAPRMQRVT